MKTDGNSLPRQALSLLLAALLLPALPAALRADGFIYVHHPHPVPHPPPRPPRPLPRPHFPLRVTNHRVVVEIEDTLVRTRVEETFHNPNPTQLDGTYLFPLPPGAVVGDFRMKIGGKEIAGEVLEKDKARRIYEDIVRRALDPGLLEYVERGLFRARVFPIPARGGVDVTFEYSENVRRDAGVAEYRYPLDTGKYSAGDYENVVIDVRLKASQTIRSVHCPTHEVSIDRKGEREVRLGYEARRLRADKDFILQWNVSEDELAPLLVTHRSHEKEGYFYFSIAPRPDRPQSIPPKDLIFVIDTSGSMRTGAKLAQVQEALRYCLDGLNDKDRFNIVDFSTEARRFRPEAVEASAENRKLARAYVDAFVARGGTNIEEALRFALEGRPKDDRLRMVVLLTDGEPTFGITRTPELLASIRKRNEAKQRIFVFGVGEDLNAKLLDQVVREHRGVATYIRREQSIEAPLSSFYDKIDSPVLTDIRIRVPGAAISQVVPAPLPDLFKGDQLDLFGRYQTDGRKTVVVEGRYLGEPRVFEYALDFSGGRNENVPRLWAMRRIALYLEKMRLSGETRELREEVIRLSKLHGIVTPYTSYLILEEGAQLTRNIRRPGGRGGMPSDESLRLTRRFAASDALGGAGWSRGARTDGDGRPTPGAPAEEARRARVSSAARAEAEAFDRAAGADAVELSRELGELKRGRLTERAKSFLDGTVQSGGVRIVQAADRTFYLQGDRWIDSALTTKDLTDRSALRRVKYLSDEYFALLREHPGIGKLLAVGKLVTFVWGERLISIVE